MSTTGIQIKILSMSYPLLIRDVKQINEIKLKKKKQTKHVFFFFFLGGGGACSKGRNSYFFSLNLLNSVLTAVTMVFTKGSY